MFCSLMSSGNQYRGRREMRGGGRIGHSGRTPEEPHWPIHSAQNGQVILEKIHEFDLSVPHIAQGKFDYGIEDGPTAELRYVMKKPKRRISVRIPMEVPPTN